MSIIDDLMRDPRALNNVGTTVDAMGAGIGALSHLEFGIQSKQAAEFQAAQLRQNAGQAMASSQRAAEDANRNAQYITSAALAAAAGSGGGASDPTVVNIIAKNAAEGAYRQSVALYQGEDKAQALETSANAKEYEGRNVLANSAMVGAGQVVGAGTTLLKGAARDSSIFQRFGGGGPKLGSTNDAWVNNGPGE